MADEQAGLNAGAFAAKSSLEGARNAAGVSAKSAPIFYKNLPRANKPRVVIGARFPGWVVNNPTKRHIIGARKLGTKAGFRKREAGIGALSAFGGTNKFKPRTIKRGSFALGGGLAAIAGSPRPYAFHSGTRGKDFWSKGEKAAQQTAPSAFRQATLTKPLREIF